jgi:hypothetical protein
MSWIGILDVFRLRVGKTERRMANADVVIERPPRGLGAGVDTFAHRTALHEYDRVVTVFTGHRRRKAKHVAGLGAPGDQLKAHRRQMMASSTMRWP